MNLKIVEQYKYLCDLEGRPPTFVGLLAHDVRINDIDTANAYYLHCKIYGWTASDKGLVLFRHPERKAMLCQQQFEEETKCAN